MQYLLGMSLRHCLGMKQVSTDQESSVQALKRIRDSQEQSLHQTIAVLQSDNALVADNKGQLEKSLRRICTHVRGISKVTSLHPSEQMEDSARQLLLESAQLVQLSWEPWAFLQTL